MERVCSKSRYFRRQQNHAAQLLIRLYSRFPSAPQNHADESECKEKHWVRFWGDIQAGAAVVERGDFGIAQRARPDRRFVLRAVGGEAASIRWVALSDEQPIGAGANSRAKNRIRSNDGIVKKDVERVAASSNDNLIPDAGSHAETSRIRLTDRIRIKLQLICTELQE